MVKIKNPKSHIYMSRNNIQLGANGFSPEQTRGLGLGVYVYVGQFV